MRSVTRPPAKAVPAQSPSQAQLLTRARRSVAVSPSQMHASAVPLDDFGVGFETPETDTSSSNAGVAIVAPCTFSSSSNP